MNFAQGIALAAHNLQNQLWDQNNSSYFQMNLCLYCKKNLAIFDSQRKNKMKKHYQNTCDDAFCKIQICFFCKCAKWYFVLAPLSQ